MADEPNPAPAGTDAPAATDTPEGATATAEGAAGSDEGGEKKVSITSHEYVTLKAAREREKALEAKVRELESAAPRATTTTDSGADDDFTMTDAERAQYRKELRAAAKAGSRDAAAVLVSIEAADELRADMRRQRFDAEMEKVPEERRDEVKAYMKETGAPSPRLAYQLMRGGKDYETLAEKAARLEKELAEAKASKTPIKGTRIVGSPASADDDGVPLISLDEYNDRMRKDPHKTIAERKAGKFRLKN